MKKSCFKLKDDWRLSKNIFKLCENALEGANIFDLIVIVKDLLIIAFTGWGMNFS